MFGLYQTIQQIQSRMNKQKQNHQQTSKQVTNQHENTNNKQNIPTQQTHKRITSIWFYTFNDHPHQQALEVT
jgi:hypothetical protein